MADTPRDRACYGEANVIRSGEQFGRLTVVKRHGRIKGVTYWLCRCDCGSEKIVRHGQLTSGRTKSCGCLAAEQRKNRNYRHGMQRTPEWKAWVEAKSRCQPKNPKHQWYADRGIKVCDEWANDFRAFFDHMGSCPTGASLDRIDNNKGYEPGNCRWATKIKQANNTRTNRFITAFGKRQTLAEWSREFGVRASTIAYRLRQTRMTREEAVSRQTMGANRST